MRRMEKRFLISFAAAVFGAALLGGCQKKAEDPVERIQGAGVLKAASCDVSEEETELVKVIGNQLGVSAELIPAGSAQEAGAMVANGQADIAIGMIPDTADLGEGLDRSIHYAEGRLYVLTRRGDYSDSPAAFSGRSLGVLTEMEGMTIGWSTDTYALNIVPYTQDNEALSALKSEIIDGYVCRLDQGMALLEAEPQVQMQNLQSVSKEKYVILAKKEDSRLLGGINTIIGTWVPGESGVTEETSEEAVQ